MERFFIIKLAAVFIACMILGSALALSIVRMNPSDDANNAPAQESEADIAVCSFLTERPEDPIQTMDASMVFYDEKPAETYAIIHNPYEDISLTEDEIILCSKVVYAEARGEEYEGQVAIAEVIFNRLLHDEFPDTITKVIKQKNAFSIGKTYTQTQTQAVQDALSGMGVLEYNADVVFFGTKQPKYGSYFCTIGNHIFNTYV